MYERPEILAHYEVEQLADDAALCFVYRDQLEDPSDERLKRDVEVLGDALERLSRLRRS